MGTKQNKKFSPERKPPVTCNFYGNMQAGLSFLMTHLFVLFVLICAPATVGFIRLENRESLREELTFYRPAE